MLIRDMTCDDWNTVSFIYEQGLNTKYATFQTKVPDYNEWDKGHLKVGRIVIEDENSHVIGWAALSPTSSRAVYCGVVEVSIYVRADYRKRGIGSELLKELIIRAEESGFWTMQSSIFVKNSASIKLHKRYDFREVGIREKIAKDADDNWQDIVLMERRSKKI